MKKLFCQEQRKLVGTYRCFGGLLLGLMVASGPVPAAEHNLISAEASSIDDLFGDPAPGAKRPTSQPVPSATAPARPGDNTMEVAQPPAPTTAAPLSPSTQRAVTAPPSSAPLFVEPSEAQSVPSRSRVTGFFRNELAYTYAGSSHWSRFDNTLDLAAQGSKGGGGGWKLGVRVNYDPIYDLNSYYPDAVRHDQRFEAMIREAFVDLPAGDWEFRLGRQHIVWGEMVGLFFADVVSAKDMRELVLPDFDMIRIPQWAGRAEYFQGDFHAEGAWIPYMTYDDIGKPGAEFYPYNPPAIPGWQTVIASEEKPTRLKDSAYGVRLSYIKAGWDMSTFYYSANDPAAAFARTTTLLPVPTITYTPIHERIHQVGGTLGKDLGAMVLKAEAVYTRDKLFSTTDAPYTDGLVKQNILDYIVGLEWSLPEETRFNAQLYQRRFFNYAPGVVPDKNESGFSLLFSTQGLHPRLEPELFLVHSLNRNDWLARFKMTWKPGGNWRLVGGIDVFGGPPTGLFGAFDSKDRAYTEARYNF